jgi:hypothetical protein
MASKRLGLGFHRILSLSFLLLLSLAQCAKFCDHYPAIIPAAIILFLISGALFQVLFLMFLFFLSGKNI